MDWRISRVRRGSNRVMHGTAQTLSPRLDRRKCWGHHWARLRPIRCTRIRWCCRATRMALVRALGWQPPQKQTATDQFSRTRLAKKAAQPSLSITIQCARAKACPISRPVPSRLTKWHGARSPNTPPSQTSPFLQWTHTSNPNLRAWAVRPKGANRWRSEVVSRSKLCQERATNAPIRQDRRIIWSRRGRTRRWRSRCPRVRPWLTFRMVSSQLNQWICWHWCRIGRRWRGSQWRRKVVVIESGSSQWICFIDRYKGRNRARKILEMDR